MKTPPLLLGAALVFWGWQTGYFLAGLLLGCILEASRVVTTRWEFSDEDFNRIWTFCTLLFLATTVYAFTSNEAPSEFRVFLENPSPWTQRNAGIASARTAASLVKWLPMTFFLFMGAQAYSSRAGVPLETISLILRRRWKKAAKAGKPLPKSRPVDLSYYYFGVCLLASTMRPAEDHQFFWGLSMLLAWALWPLRSPRFGLPLWIGTMLAVVVLGYYGQGGLNRLRSYLEGINPQWFSHFSRRGFDPGHSRTALGRVGRLKMSGTIVIRVEQVRGAPPTLLREASYRSYRAPFWHSDISRSSFENLNHEANGTSWVLLANRTNDNAARIGTYLPGGRGLLPLPTGSSRLDNLGAFVLQKNDLGAVAAEGPGLLVFESEFGPGQTLDAAPSNLDREEIPAGETNALSQLAGELGLQGKPPEEVLENLTRFFADNFTYSVEHEPARNRTNQTALSQFLLEDRKGHCEYFATATVLMLRTLGIPARYAVGYVVHEGSGGKYVVRERDAHAWCLVWDNARGMWQDFDTTPASWMPEEKKFASRFQGLSDAWSRLKFEFSKFRYGQTNWRRYILWGVTPILVLLLLQIVIRGRRQKRRSVERVLLQNWPGLDSDFYKLEAQLVKRGLTRNTGESLARWLRRAASQPGLSDLRPALQQLLTLHYRYRFDPVGLPNEDRDSLRMRVAEILSKLGQK